MALTITRGPYLIRRCGERPTKLYSDFAGPGSFTEALRRKESERSSDAFLKIDADSTAPCCQRAISKAQVLRH
jgi:hypothetical protein